MATSKSTQGTKLPKTCPHCGGRARPIGPVFGGAARMRCDKCTRQWSFTFVKEA